MPAIMNVSDWPGRDRDARFLSDVQLARSKYQPPLPTVLEDAAVTAVEGGTAVVTTPEDESAIRRAFPHTYGLPVVSLQSGIEHRKDGEHEVTITTPRKQSQPLRVGIVFCGRQSPGGHNVVAGLYDFLRSSRPGSAVIGFLQGTEGLFSSKYVEVTDEMLALYRNQGGYDLLGRTIDRIRTRDEYSATRAVCDKLSLDGLVLIGGSKTQTDAASLAEWFAAQGVRTRIVGVPVSIDGDLRNPFVETDLGFDTACRVCSELIGNISIDAVSAFKYYYFIRLMGRGPSHIALECALETHPNIVLVSEEVEANQMTLNDVVQVLCHAIARRADHGKNFGMVLLPEGLVESIPEMRNLIAELNALLKEGVDPKEAPGRLTPWSRAVLSFLPAFFQEQLFGEREVDGTVLLSKIETERLLAELVDAELKNWKKNGSYKGSFSPICYFFGYQARSSLPTNFDCAYGQALGYTAGVLIGEGRGGYLAVVSNLKAPAQDWRAGGVPLAALLRLTRARRAGETVTPAVLGPDGVDNSSIPAAVAFSLGLAVPSANVSLTEAPFKLLKANVVRWMLKDEYRNPGPIQFQGASAEGRLECLKLEDNDYLGDIQRVKSALSEIEEMCKPGCSQAVLKAASETISSLATVLKMLQ
eukprot:jgi/Chlat1/492/Chrsp103S01092